MTEIPAVDERQFRKILKSIGESADARTVFGETVVFEGRAVIPVARVDHKGGGGFGGGGGSQAECTPHCPPDCDGQHAEEGYGSGMGLGYAIDAEPVGVIEVTAEEVRWIPTIDYNRLALMAAAAFGVAVIVSAIGELLERR